MTADPTPAADPRLAELTEALRQNWPTYNAGTGGFTGGPMSYGAEQLAARLLALMPATTEAVALAAERQAVIDAAVSWTYTQGWTRDDVRERLDSTLGLAVAAYAAALAATGGSDDR